MWWKRGTPAPSDFRRAGPSTPYITPLSSTQDNAQRVQQAALRRSNERRAAANAASPDWIARDVLFWGRGWCKLASLTAEVAPVKSPKDHVATRGPGTPKVHHGTQNAVQVVDHLRNTRASSRKELPAALRRSSGHESSADWLTATEQQDKNVAAAYSCLFSSFPSFCSILLFSSILLLFYGSVLSSLLFYSILSVFCSLFYSLYWALVLSPLLSYSYWSCFYSLHRSSLYSSSSRRYCLHLRGSSSVPSSGVFFSSTSSTSSIVEAAADVSSSSAPPSNLRVYSGSLSSEAPHFFTNTCPSGIFSSSPSWLLWFLKYSSAHPSVCRSVACRWWRRRPY